MTYRTLTKPSDKNLQIQEYVNAAQKGLKSHLVIPTDKGWSVKRADAQKASAVLPTKKQAISHARRLAKNQNTEVHVFGS